MMRSSAAHLATLSWGALSADRILGGSGGDRLLAMAGEGNVVSGGDDDDNIVGSGGGDSLAGGGGRDIIELQEGDSVQDARGEPSRTGAVAARPLSQRKL